MLGQFFFLLAVHWFGDFVLQTHWQASNKSKRADALFRHVSSYTAALTIGTVALFGFNSSVAIFIGLNAWLHFLTDLGTSRWTAYLHAKQDWHNFFVVVGLDQLIHQTTLGITMWYFLNQG